jgi:hypothetical protein
VGSDSAFRTPYLIIFDEPPSGRLHAKLVELKAQPVTRKVPDQEKPPPSRIFVAQAAAPELPKLGKPETGRSSAEELRRSLAADGGDDVFIAVVQLDDKIGDSAAQAVDTGRFDVVRQFMNAKITGR